MVTMRKAPVPTSPTSSTAQPHSELPLWRRVTAAWREARPAVQIIFQLRLLTVVAIASASTGTMPDVVGVALCCAGWFCLTWAIYLLNGITDQVEDRLNGSTRPIASGELDGSTARALVIVLSGTGLSLCLAAGGHVFIAAVLMSVLGYLYSAGTSPLKRTVCGVQVSVVGGGILTYAAAVLAADVGFPLAALVFAVALSAWMGVGGLSKDLSDVAGDREAGRSTLPMWSENGARAIITAVAFAIAGCLAAASVLAPQLIATAVILVVGSALVAAAAASRRHRTRDPRAPYKAFMLTQYGAHAGTVCFVL